MSRHDDMRLMAACSPELRLNVWRSNPLLRMTSMASLYCFSPSSPSGVASLMFGFRSDGMVCVMGV